MKTKWIATLMAIGLVICGHATQAGTFPPGDYTTAVSSSGAVLAGVIINSDGNLSRAIVRDEVFFSSSVLVDTVNRKFSAERGSYSSGKWAKIEGELKIIRLSDGSHPYYFAFDSYVIDLDNAAGYFISESCILLGVVRAPFPLEGSYETGQRLTSLNLGYQQKELTISVPNPDNFEWSISSDAEWATVTKIDGSTFGHFILSLEENDTDELRSCSISLVSYGIRQTINIFQYDPSYTFTVTFDLDGKGERIGGGELIQDVPNGFGASAPVVQAHDEWVFTGWDVAFDNILADTTVTALYRTPVVGDAMEFNPDADTLVRTLAVQADGKVLVGGDFTSIGGQTRKYIARLNPDGTLDEGFNPDASYWVFSLAVQPDGKILVGGWFTSIGGVTRNSIARLNPDGTLDTDFNPNAAGIVGALAVQPDGKILLAGGFTSVGGVPRNRIARLNQDGTLDMDFNPNANEWINTMVLQADGKILVGGSKWLTSVGGLTRNRIARLNPDGTLDTSFNPNANSSVHTLAVQPDGKIIVGGDFTHIGGQTRNRIARLNPDGKLDTDFNPVANSDVDALAVQADGKILIGGYFTSIGGEPSNRLAWLHPDGTLDKAYSGSTGTIKTIALQADGKILVGGGFTSVGGASRNRIARLHNDIATDELSVPSASHVTWKSSGAFPYLSRVTFDLSTDDGVSWTAIGSGFPVENGWELTELSLPSNGIIRARAVISNGGQSESLLELFENFSLPVFTVDFDIGEHGEYIGGGALSQTVVYGGAAANPEIQAYEGFAHIGWDLAFDSVTNDLTVTAVYATTHMVNFDLGGKGMRICGGELTQLVVFGDAAIAPIVDPQTGWAHTGWDIAFDNVTKDLSVTAVYVATHTVTFDLSGKGERLDGGELTQTVLHGSAAVAPSVGALRGWVFVDWNISFDSVTQDLTVSAQYRQANPGDVEELFDPNANRSIRAMAVQPDGKILVGGSFTSMGGESRNRIARLNSDGTLDTDFNPNANAAVHALGVQSDGKILVGGTFSQMGGLARSRIARLNPDGSLDPNFNPNATGNVDAIAILADDSILIGGGFTSMGGVARSRIARLNPDGTIDTTFNPNVDGGVMALVPQRDGKVLVGGAFTTIEGVERIHLARLNSDGSLDSTFNPNMEESDYLSFVCTLAVQSDGKILLAGQTRMGGQDFINIARLNSDGTIDTHFCPYANGPVRTLSVQSDGKILLGGSFTWLGRSIDWSERNHIIDYSERNRIARLNPDGTLDNDFNPNANASVDVLAVQPDGRVLVGGSFTSMGDVVRNNIAGICGGNGQDLLIVAGADTVEWQLPEYYPEAIRVSIDHSTDGGETWSHLGEGMRIQGGWRLEGLSLLGEGLVRARAVISHGGQSTSLIEQFTSYPVNEFIVEFNVGENGVRVGGGALFQTVLYGGAAIEPNIETHAGWMFNGWDEPFDNITGDLTVTALYSLIERTFSQWLADENLSGDASELFRQICPERGIAHGFRYAFGDNLPQGEPLLTLRMINGRMVVETPSQVEVTAPYVDVRLRGSANLIDWTLPLRPAQDTTGKPADSEWHEPEGDSPDRAFYRLEVELK